MEKNKECENCKRKELGVCFLHQTFDNAVIFSNLDNLSLPQ